LTPALEDLVSSVRSRGIAVTLDLPAGTGLDPAGERLVFRVAQECLGNVARHSNASSVVVRLARESGYTVLDVADDGIGFDAGQALAHPPEGHFGLRVLGDVASQAGAELWLASAPGEGTQWRLRVPR
jgi:signal transduction histidine kinase